jgi:hypothetical protein
MAKQLKYLVTSCDWKDPFPIDEAIACYKEWGIFFLSALDIGNDSFNYVFSNQLIDDEKAMELLKQSFADDKK